MALGDWVSGLFQSEQTRGLSGGSAPSVALDDANPYYNYRLRRHRAEGDLVADPSLLWYTSPFVKQRSGLGTHVASEIGDGTANYTDVLVILSKGDHDAAGRSATWFADAQRVLGQEFETLCRREGLRRRYEHRPLAFRFVADGDDFMAGQSLGLTRGEFVTGLLPNLYTGPVRGSWPIVAVHLNIPGAWDGYREVGRLHNDQRLFTIGAHWLDNFSHPLLREAALYRLQQYPSGSFVHIVNPDLQDRYQVTSEDQDGTHVLTLATRDGDPLAYMVLVALEAPAGRPVSMSPEDLPTGPAPRPPIPSVAPPMLLDDESEDDDPIGKRTIIPDAPNERIFTFQERGVLLQKVHFSAFMLGYDVYFGRRGELGTVVEDPAATFQVRRKTVSIVPHVDGVSLDGAPLTVGEEYVIDRDVRIEVAGQRLEYRHLRAFRGVNGWPYVGEIRRPASSTYMIWGDTYQVGRSRDCRVVLPDETRNDNIRWKPKVGDGATIRARTGDIPKSKFYTDSIMVASEHGTVDLRDTKPRVVCNARHCYVFVRRAGQLNPLYPVTSADGPKDLDLEPGDEVLIGNCLFHIGFTPAEDGARPAPAPPVTLEGGLGQPTSLADAPAPPSLPPMRPMRPPPTTDDVTPPPPRPRPTPMMSLSDVPSPRGLGDAAPPPPPAPLPPPVPAPPPPPPPPRPVSAVPPPLPEPAEPTFEPVYPPPPDADDDETLALDARERARLRREQVEPPGASGLGEEASPPSPVQLPRVGQDSILGTMSTVQALPTDDEALPSLDDYEDDETIPGLVDPFRERLAPVDPPSPVPQPDVGGWDEDWAPAAGEAPEAAANDAEPTADPGDAPAPEPAEDDAAPPAPGQAPDAGDAPSEAPEPDDAPEDEASVEPPIAPVTDPAEPAIDAPADEAPPVAEPPARAVVFTDDREAQFELGRPMHVVLAGWMLNGEAVCGNHSDADLVLPENRIVEDQVFEPVDYFRLKVRGRRGKLTILAPTELLIDEDDPSEAEYPDPEARTIDVIRRDELGDEDFAIRLQLEADRSLPDPRARLLSLDYEDPLAAALVTRGLPKGTERTLDLGGIRMTLRYDGAAVTVSDYLDTYRRGDAFHPFFVQQGERRFTTAPEDGTPFELVSGDRFVVGTYVYVLLEE